MSDDIPPQTSPHTKPKPKGRPFASVRDIMAQRAKGAQGAKKP